MQRSLLRAPSSMWRTSRWKEACHSSCHQGRRREYSWNEATQWSVLWLIDFRAFKDLSGPLCVKSQGIFPGTVRVLLAMTLCPWGQPHVQTLPSSRSEPHPCQGQISQPAELSLSVWHPTDSVRNADWEDCTADPEPIACQVLHFPLPPRHCTKASFP